MLIFAPYFLIEYWTLNLYMTLNCMDFVCTQYLYYNKGLYRCASKYLLKIFVVYTVNYWRRYFGAMLFIIAILARIYLLDMQSHFDSLSFAFNMSKF